MHPSSSDSALFRGIWKTFPVQVSFRLTDYVQYNSAGENSSPAVTANCLITSRKPPTVELESKGLTLVSGCGPCLTVLTLQGSISSRVLVCGQCHDKLSILSVTVAGSPSGTTGSGERRGVHRPGPSPSSHSDVSVGQQVTESSNCNLWPLLIWGMKEKHRIKWYTVLEKSMPVMASFYEWPRSVSGFQLSSGRGF